MISPGTIRAMAKMRQGVNPDAALTEGANLDLYFADRRSQMFAIRNQETQAQNAARTSTTFSPKPLPPVQSTAQTTSGETSSAVPKITDTGVPKSMSQFAFGPTKANVPQQQTVKLTAPEQIKFGTTKQTGAKTEGIKPPAMPTSLAGMSLVTTPTTVGSTYVPASRLEEFAITTQRTASSLAKEGLYKGNNDLKSLLDNNSSMEEGLAKLLDNTSLSVQEFNIKKQ